jgi:signal transduction histidine kinase
VTDRKMPEQTGLGLAIVRSVAQLHGGSVELIDPEDGPGACFEMTLSAR